MVFLRALSVFVGTIIGVGIFGLPYVTSKAGFIVVVLYFLFLSAIVILIKLLFSEVSLGTEGLHRLPGYAEQYLGSRWKKISFLTAVLGLTGALLAYLIIGGEFLYNFFNPHFGGNNLIYTLIFFSSGALLIFLGIKSISQIELSLLVVFFVILILFFLRAFPFINTAYFKTLDLRFFAFPYGVILFSLWAGSAMVDEVKEIVNGNRQILRKVVTTGIILSAVTYLFFIFVVLGASGPKTSEEAISGLSSTLGDGIIRLGFIFGVITCFTSYLTLGLTLKKILWYDFNLSENLSWLIACFPPLFLFLAGLRKFIDIISLTGAFAIGCEGIIIVFLYRAFLERKFSRKMNPLFYILPLVFVLGVVFEIFYFVNR